MAVETDGLFVQHRSYGTASCVCNVRCCFGHFSDGNRDSDYLLVLGSVGEVSGTMVHPHSFMANDATMKILSTSQYCC